MDDVAETGVGGAAQPEFLEWPVFRRLMIRVKDSGLPVKCGDDVLIVGPDEISFDDCWENPDRVVMHILRLCESGPRTRADARRTGSPAGAVLSDRERSRQQRAVLHPLIFERENSWPERWTSVRYAYDR